MSHTGNNKWDIIKDEEQDILTIIPKTGLDHFHPGFPQSTWIIRLPEAYDLRDLLSVCLAIPERMVEP